MTEGVLSYEGYIGSAELSIEDDCLQGQVLHINDLVVYEGQTIDEIRKNFRSAVDHYLKTCKDAAREPDKAYSGTFNVRVGQVLHRAAAVYASAADTSLNELVVTALREKLQNHSNENEIVHLVPAGRAILGSHSSSSVFQSTVVSQYDQPATLATGTTWHAPEHKLKH